MASYRNRGTMGVILGAAVVFVTFSTLLQTPNLRTEQLPCYTGSVIVNDELSTIGNYTLAVSTVSTQVNKADATSIPPTILDRCYKGRFQGYWDFDLNCMRFFDPVCDESLVTLVQLSNSSDASVKPNEMYGNHTNPVLFDRLAGSCVLLLGDSTDRQIAEQWCQRWVIEGVKSEIWMPPNGAERLSRNQALSAGTRCNVHNSSFTFGQYRHYGVCAPPYFRFAHMYVKGPKGIEMGNTTEARVKQDVPKFFQRCDEVGHDKFKVVVLQSYMWDLSREDQYGKTKRPSPRFISEWATNVTTMVSWVREAVPDAMIAWRFAGDLEPSNRWDSQTMHDMNAAILALGDKMNVDFFTDYGAVLDSTLASVKNQKPFDVHPPAEPQTGYVNIMLNALIAAYDAKINA